MTEEEINWDEAVENTGFVSLKTDTEKKLVLTNWKLEKRPINTKVAPGEIEFIAKVIKEDNEEVEDRIFSTTSKRLKQKLRPIFENKDTTEKVEISILRVGEQFNTQYSVKEI